MGKQKEKVGHTLEYNGTFAALINCRHFKICSGLEFVAFFNFAAFSTLYNYCGTTCDFFICTAKFVGF